MFCITKKRCTARAVALTDSPGVFVITKKREVEKVWRGVCIQRDPVFLGLGREGPPINMSRISVSMGNYMSVSQFPDRDI